MSTLNPKIKYEYMPWGEIISGSKEALQRLGIAIGMAFPGEPGAPKRCVKIFDPRGFPARIIKSYLGEEYSACIDIPGRERPEDAPEIVVAPGVAMREHYHFNAYTGTADALIVAGLVLPGQFPGQPGMRKVIVTIFADGTIPSGAPTIRHRRADEPGAKRVRRASKTTYQVSVNVPEDESERRREAYFAARDKYEARMRALPRPRPLSTAGDAGHPDVNRRLNGTCIILDLHAARAARQHGAAEAQGGCTSASVDAQVNVGHKRPRQTTKERQATQEERSDENLNLTEDEKKIIMDYRRMNKASRECMQRVFPEVARKDQERSAAESRLKLRLIQGGA